MSVLDLDMAEVLAGLAEVRPIFHSEADFQHALAWEIHSNYPDWQIRLERPALIDGSTVYVDLWVSDGGDVVAIELKYCTDEFACVRAGENYGL